MNSRCPICSHHFRLRERKRFVTWRCTRRPVPCPDCRTMLVCERGSHLRLWTGMLFLIIFDSILIGTSLAPQIGVLFGFSSPESVHDPYWQSWSVRLIEIL